MLYLLNYLPSIVILNGHNIIKSKKILLYGSYGSFHGNYYLLFPILFIFKFFRFIYFSVEHI